MSGGNVGYLPDFSGICTWTFMPAVLSCYCYLLSNLGLHIRDVHEGWRNDNLCTAQAVCDCNFSADMQLAKEVDLSKER